MPTPPPTPAMASTVALSKTSHMTLDHHGSRNSISHGTTTAWASSTASPRRTAVALDGPVAVPAAAATGVNAGVAIYDKQLLWKQHGQKKTEHKTLELLGQEELECTFAPKINRPGAQSRKTSLASTSLAVSSATVPRGSYAVSPRDFVGDGGGSECSSSQYSVSSPHTVRSIESVDLRGANQDMCHGHGGCRDEDYDDEHSEVPLHPTESQENSILLHLARQGRAREEAQRAQHKLASLQPRKDFTKVTASRPFELSVTNRKPRRSTSASPTHRTARARPRAGSIVTASTATGTGTGTAPGCGGRAVAGNGGGPSTLVKRRSQGSPDDGLGAAAAHNVAGLEDDWNHATVIHHSDQQALQWQQERSTLLSVIETQQRELERRGQAQEDAARLAETFASAVQAFEHRLEIVERTTAHELSEMKQLLAKQSAATDLILHALGLANTTSPFNVTPPPPSSPVMTPSQSASSSTAGTSRRETK